MQTKLGRVITCEHCGASYTELEFLELEVTGLNIIWNFDYRRCKWCKREITPLKADIMGKIGEH
jgi:hypothetical protein